jgi:hypothetical protein
MYKLLKSVIDGSVVGVQKESEGSVSSIPFDPANTDYVAYLAWVAAGNEPLPADQPPAE